ncbi:cell division protein CdvB1/B2 [Metallosphaera hakonensis]|uniref:cell division protein CdvB1/B2 n=1 Tax=Metallosphaera hakonensis TaxID=79601 RepID=UPI0006D26D04|nr:cell division protein CdvB1/B2 [Metallosphaera hakonensis]
MLGKDFQRYWAGSEDKSAWEGLKGAFKSKEPLKYRIVQARYRLGSMINRLDVHISRLQERDRTLFERVVSAQMAKDTSRATMYANEVAEIRKMSKQLIMTQIALEQVQLRLETVSEVSEVFVNLIPIVGVVNELKTALKGVMPEISLELSSLSEDLQTVVIEAGDFAGGYSYTSAASPEARKILDEASTIAEQRMKEKFPDLPVNALAQRLKP